MIGESIWTVADWWDRGVDRWARLGAPWQSGLLALPTWGLAGVLVVLGWFSGGPSVSAALAAPAAAPVAGTTSTFQLDGGEMVLYARGPDGSWQEVRRLDQSRVPGQFAKLAATSPDRRLVAYVQADDQLLANATISVVEVATGEERALVTIPNGLFPATPVWSPDGSRLAIVRRGAGDGLELWTVGIAGGDLTRVPTDATIPPAAFYGASQTPLVWSEDSDRLSYMVPTVEGQAVRTIGEGQAVRTEVEVATGRVRLAEPVSTGPRSPCEVPVFSQNDPRWSSQTMHSLGDTIGTAGCALTATTMLLNYYGNNRTPAELNACLGAAAEPIYWASAADRDCDSGTAAFESYEDFSWARLSQLMAQARPVIVGFAGGITGSHYVVVTSGYGSDGGNYSIIDPWDGSTWKTIDYYAAKGYTPTWLVVYRGKAPECTDRSLAPPVQVPDPAAATTATGVEGTWRWRNLIEQIVAEQKLDPNAADVLQGMMALASGGNPNAVGPPTGADGRAMGLMQVMSGRDEAIWLRAAPNLGRLPSDAEMLDPTLNIRAGAIRLADLQARGERWSDWLVAGVGYFGAATPEGQLTGATDAYGTDGWTYYDRLRANVEAIRARLGRIGVVPAPPIDTRRPSTWATTGTIETIFGGAPYSISQNFGPTNFSPGPGAYDYSSAYGLRAGDHAGTDLAVPYGTPLYAPTTGEVVFAGPWQYFAPQNVQLKFADGTIAIFGHMSQVSIALGSTVQPGQPIGLSGTAGTGPHLHLEVRVPDATTSSGQRAVDPMIYFGTGGPAARFGASAGFGASGSGGTGYNWPTAEAINARIAQSEQANPGQVSPLRGKGEAFLRFGTEYGINPGVVTAVLQRESQLGADGSILPTQANNFGGITGSGTCGSIWVRDRYFARFCTVEDGLAANFAIFNLSVYRQSDGTLGRIMEIYAPPWDNNDHGAMWKTFTQVAYDINITLTPSTNIYTGYTGPAYVGGAPPAAPPPPTGGPPLGPPLANNRPSTGGAPPAVLPPPTLAPTPTVVGTETATATGTITPTATPTGTITPTATTTATTPVASPGAGSPTATHTATATGSATITGSPSPGAGTPATGTAPSDITSGSPAAGTRTGRQLQPRAGTPEAVATSTVQPGTPAAATEPEPTSTAESSPSATETTEADETAAATAGAIPSNLLPDVRILGPDDWGAYSDPVTFEGVQVIFPADPNAVVSSSVPPGTTFAQDGRYTITTTVISPQVPGGSRQFTTTFFIDSTAPTTQIGIQGIRYEGPVDDLAREIAALPSDLGTAAFAQTDTVLSLAGPLVYNRQAIVTFNAIDPLTPITAIVYRVDGGKWRYYTNSGMPHPLSFEQHGCYTVDVYAVDAAGNLESMQQTNVCVHAEDDQPIDLPTPTPVFTPTPTETPTPTPPPTPALALPTTTATPEPTPTDEPTPTVEPTPTDEPTPEWDAAPTNAAPPDQPPTPTPTDTPDASPDTVPPSQLPTTTSTPDPTATPGPAAVLAATELPATLAPPTATPFTAREDPPTNTPVPARPTNTPAPVRPTNTPVPVPSTNTPVPAATNTRVPPRQIVTPTPIPTEPAAAGTVRITTFGIDDAPIPGACYQITTENRTVLAPVCDLSDGQNDGQTTIIGVLAGTVSIAQTTKPDNHLPAEAKTGIDVPKDGSVEIAFENQPMPGQLWIDTVDEEGQSIPGACYVFTAATGESFGPFCDGDRVDADDSTRIRLNNVPAGRGILRQTQVPSIYETAPEMPVTVPPDDEAAVTVTNFLKRGDVNITDVNEWGELLPGACFTLVTYRGKYGVCDNDGGWDGNPELGKIDLRGMETGAGPSTLYQDVAPEGYRLAEPITFDILPNQPNPVTVVNLGPEAVVVKVDAYTGAPVAGAVFALYQREEEVGPRAATGADGTVTFRVPPGDYDLVELEPAPGYVEADGSYEITVPPGEPWIWYYDVTNYREPITLIVQKYAEDGTTPLLDACFVLYELSEGESAAADHAYSSYKRIGNVAYGSTMERCDDDDGERDGNIVWEWVYPFEYWLEETRAPEGYEQAGGQAIDLTGYTDVAAIPVTNRKIQTGEIHLEVYDDSGYLLVEYEFCFVAKYDNGDPTYGPFCTTDGTLDFVELPPGPYTIRQTSTPPQGILPIPDQVESVNPGETTHVKLVAAYDPGLALGDLYINVAGTGGSLAGWTFTVTGGEGGPWTVYTNDQGQAVATNLPGGYEYCAVPGVPPSGWARITPAQRCVVVPAGSSASVEFKATAIEPTQPPASRGELVVALDGGPSSIQFWVVRQGSGAVFGPVATNDQGWARFEGLPLGHYCVADVSNPRSDIDVTVDSGDCGEVSSGVGTNSTIWVSWAMRPGTLHIRVTDASGVGVAGWSFRIWRDGGHVGDVGPTDAFGDLVVSGMAGGFTYCAEPGPAPVGWQSATADQPCAVVPSGGEGSVSFIAAPVPPTPTPTPPPPVVNDTNTIDNTIDYGDCPGCTATEEALDVR